MWKTKTVYGKIQIHSRKTETVQNYWHIFFAIWIYSQALVNNFIFSKSYYIEADFVCVEKSTYLQFMLYNEPIFALPNLGASNLI